MLPLLVLLAGCSRPVDVALRLPEDATLIVTQRTTSTTRTPLGPESLEIKSVRRIQVLQGGRVGTDELHWREQFTKYTVHWENRDWILDWSLADRLDEHGDPAEIPEEMNGLMPHPPRLVWVAPTRDIYLLTLPWPEPEPEEGEEPEPAPKVEADPDAPEEEVEPEPEPRDLRVEALVSQLEPYFGGLVHGPSEPVKPGTTWSWKISQEVTRGSDVSTTATWTFDRVQGNEAVLEEGLVLSSALPPASGSFRTTDLTGGGEMRLDLNTGLPASYVSKFEATLASPSSVGASTVSVDAKFKLKSP